MTPPLSSDRVSVDPSRCEGFADAIFDRTASALDPAKARGLEAHLVGCPACRGLEDEVAQTEDALRGLLLDLAGSEPAAAAAHHPEARRMDAGRPRFLGRFAWAAGLMVAATGLGVALSWPQTARTPLRHRPRPAEQARTLPEAAPLLARPTPRPAPIAATPLAEASDTLRLALLDAFAVPE